MSVEERLVEKGYYKLGTEIYKDEGGGKLKRITTKEYQPQLFINPETKETQWIEPGKPIPKGFEKYVSQKKPTSELSVIAESLGLNLTQPLTPENAQTLIDKITDIKKERAKATLLELLLGLSSGNIMIQPPTIGGLTPEEQAELERLKAKSNGLEEGYNIIRQPIQ